MEIHQTKLWSDVTPNLYNVVSHVAVGGSIVDSRTTVTGFRQTEFRGGAGTGGVYLNGRFVYLLGFAQRASNDWAALGEAVPDWMHDYNANLIKGSNSNYIRWMHITPQRVDVASNDKYGVINISPAGVDARHDYRQRVAHRADVRDRHGHRPGGGCRRRGIGGLHPPRSTPGDPRSRC